MIHTGLIFTHKVNPVYSTLSVHIYLLILRYGTYLLLFFLVEIVEHSQCDAGFSIFITRKIMRSIQNNGCDRNYL